MADRLPLVLLRHGQSQWNLENRFTGWTDIDLTAQGRDEAHAAAAALRAAGLGFDLVVTSVLTRAIRTAWIVLDGLGTLWTPQRADWRLNERHYGALQGLDKAATARRYGAAQVQNWRRGFADRPPPLAPDDPHAPASDPRYAQIDPAALPRTESLADTVARTHLAWDDLLAPALARGRRILVVAHGNSLRAIIMKLEGLDESAIATLEPATGKPIAYALDAAGRPVARRNI